MAFPGVSRPGVVGMCKLEGNTGAGGMSTLHWRAGRLDASRRRDIDEGLRETGRIAGGPLIDKLGDTIEGPEVLRRRSACLRWLTVGIAGMS